MTLREFLAVFTVNDPVAGRALNTTTNGGVDSLGDLLTLSDPSGGRAIKIVISGGVTKFWTEAYNAGTQATSSWTATGAAANINATIVPKGTGALTAQIPDGTVTGGNARGTSAIDFQIARTVNNEVASGAYSVVVGGYRNKSTNTYCAILGGERNTASNIGSAVLGGSSNTSSGQQSVIGGGDGNQATAFLSAVFSGYQNIASSGKAFIGGGQGSTASGEYSNISGGFLNTASGYASHIGGGQSNSATSTHDFVGGGQSNVTGGSDNSFWKFIGGGSNNSVNGSQTSYSGIGCGNANTINNGRFNFIGGGGSNTIFTPWYSFIGGGQNNYLDGNNGNSSHQAILGGSDNRTFGNISAIIGGAQAYTSLFGQIAHASGQFSARGDAQAHELIWRRAITGTAQTELFLDGASAAAVLPGTNSIWQGTVNIAAVCTTTGDGTTIVGHVAATSYKVTIKRIGTTTSLVGAVQELGTATNADGSMATSVITIDNNDTNESLRIRFTPPGTAGSTTVIRVVATFSGLQIQY